MFRSMGVNNGSVLVNGYITWPWANVLFWRTFFAITAHYMSVFIMASIGMKRGFFVEEAVDLKMEEVLNRPPEDTTTMFSFVRQMFYHKTLAYTMHEKEQKKAKRR